MSKETPEWLNNNVLAGYGRQMWHREESLMAEENVYPGAIPVGEVKRRLFGWHAVPRRVAVELPCGIDEMTHIGEDGRPMRWVVQDDRQAMARDDNDLIMGLFKDGYQGHQYDEWLIGAVSNILGESLGGGVGGLGIGSAGLLKGGAVAWVQVELPDVFRNRHGVNFHPRLLGFTSFDGSLATSWKMVNGIVVCDNTMEAARGESGAIYKIKHTRNSGYRLKDARQALGLVEREADEFDTEINALCETTVTDRQWFAFLDTYVPTVKDGEKLKGRSLTMAEGKRDALSRLWTHDARVAPWRGTAWGVRQAVNTWGHWEQMVRGAERTERIMLSAIKGDQAKMDDGALEVLGKVLATV